MRVCRSCTPFVAAVTQLCVEESATAGPHLGATSKIAAYILSGSLAPWAGLTLHAVQEDKKDVCSSLAAQKARQER